ncbi:unnamed protein product [Victoria cruziana]
MANIIFILDTSKSTSALSFSQSNQLG